MVFIALDLLSRGEEALALTRLSECKLLASEIENPLELELVFVLEALIYNRLGQFEKVKELRFNRDVLLNGPYGGLASLVAEHLNLPIFERGKSLSALERAFAELLGIPLNREVFTKYAGRTKLTTLSEAHKLARSSQFALVLDLASGTIRIGSETFSEKQRPAISTFIKILHEHPGSAISREVLCNRIWTEDYHPLTHDPRLATLVTRIRAWAKAGGHVNFIETASEGFRIGVGVPTLEISRREISGSVSPSQKWILDHIASTGTIQRSRVVSVMKCSPEKAKRELAALVQKGLLVKVGYGRSAHYRSAS